MIRKNCHPQVMYQLMSLTFPYQIHRITFMIPLTRPTLRQNDCPTSRLISTLVKEVVQRPLGITKTQGERERTLLCSLN